MSDAEAIEALGACVTLCSFTDPALMPQPAPAPAPQPAPAPAPLEAPHGRIRAATGNPLGRPAVQPVCKSPYGHVTKGELYTDLLRFHLDKKQDLLGCSKGQFSLKYTGRSDTVYIKVQHWLRNVVMPRLNDMSIIVEVGTGWHWQALAGSTGWH